ALLLAPAAARAALAASLFPADRLYPHYTADPRSPEFGMALLHVADPALPETGSQRFAFELGGRFGLLRLHPEGRADAGWQLDIHAGFLGQFDLEHSLDNLGWDGLYGFLASTRLGHGLSLQLGTKHVSSHVGDEYVERSGRRRIGYTREELAAGLAWSGSRGGRLYGEVGWGHSPKRELGQERGRLQAGAELHRAVAGRRRLGWYGALDLGAMEERGWGLDATLELGLVVPSGDRRWRVGLALYDGRMPLGEFFRDDEAFAALGLWLEP
ncbi:MAG TPA: DUF1207 domain-containing protein, partial [Thermoanaerobaculia bacterium]|nr:DUF1207 domain-containing protein [Thermoanaerobaculia bacterium]